MVVPTATSLFPRRRRVHNRPLPIAETGRQSPIFAPQVFRHGREPSFLKRGTEA
jgi:hypothetical protein